MVARYDDHHVERLVRLLSDSLVLVHAVDGYGEASMIFQTVNDRGKRLTDLEALKSFLMHTVGVTTKSALAESQATEALQRNFSDVYRMINRFELNMPEDDALRWCYLTFRRPPANGTVDYWNGEGSAKDDAKRWLMALARGDQQNIAFDACLALGQHIQTCFQKVEAVLNNHKRWEEISRLLTLRRIAVFWPILLNTYADDQPEEERAFRCILRLCEIASLKIWGIGDYRSNKAQSELIRIAQQEDRDRRKVILRMRDLLKWWDIPDRWRDGLLNNTFYFQGRDARYILFRVREPS